MFDLDPLALEALAGLRPMPRTPLTINPCPEGYGLQNLGGKLMCVLEGAESMTPEDAANMARHGTADLGRFTNPPRFTSSTTSTPFGHP